MAHIWWDATIQYGILVGGEPKRPDRHRGVLHGLVLALTRLTELEAGQIQTMIEDRYAKASKRYDEVEALRAAGAAARGPEF